MYHRQLSMFSEMEEDPFFSDPFHSHQENLRQLMSSFPAQWDQDLLVNFMDGKVPTQTGPRQHNSKEGGKHSEVASSSVDPFKKMMEQMRKEMVEMQHNIKNAPYHPNDHTLNTSTVMSYAKVGNEPAKVFQASSHVHRVPGGIKETRRAVKDSESGIEKISIGHHIKDRAHVIQKLRNQKTGDEEVDQEFINLNEDDALMFDQEWRGKVSKFMPPGAQISGLQDVKKAMEGQRKCWQHSAGQAASVEGETELTCQVDDLSPELEDFRDEQLLRPNTVKNNLFRILLLPLLVVAALIRALLL